jgi:hypothetical protein
VRGNARPSLASTRLATPTTGHRDAVVIVAAGAGRLRVSSCFS